MNERTPISAIKGIGEKTEKLFEKLGVYTVKDLISHFPRGYEYYNKAASIGELEEGRVQTVTGVIYGRAKVSQNRRTPVTSVFVKDSSGMLKVIWFQMPFFEKHARFRGRNYASGADCPDENRICDGTPGNFLPQ